MTRTAVTHHRQSPWTPPSDFPSGRQAGLSTFAQPQRGRLRYARAARPLSSLPKPTGAAPKPRGDATRRRPEPHRQQYQRGNTRLMSKNHGATRRFLCVRRSPAAEQMPPFVAHVIPAKGSNLATWPLSIRRTALPVCSGSVRSRCALGRVCCGTGAMELRRRKREGETTLNSEALDRDSSVDVHSVSGSEAAADAVVGAAVRGGSLLMLLALIQVGVGGHTW